MDGGRSPYPCVCMLKGHRIDTYTHRDDDDEGLSPLVREHLSSSVPTCVWREGETSRRITWKMCS